ncbi:E3 gp19K [Human adenovirus 65]|uniref:Early E3 18.5 kDa glycoprotein n=1 Tax=Human adenovirus 65 TaxID=1094363 RepID=H0PPG8_9ADEN|nr:E3 gp19K [Human adenovirus 65]
MNGLLLIILSLVGGVLSCHEQPRCNITTGNHMSRECTVVIKCEHDCPLNITFKNNTMGNVWVGFWEPGDEQNYTVTVHGSNGNHTFGFKFIFEVMCDITLHVARLHGLWPPTKENMIGFSLAFVIMACLMSGLLVGALVWFLKRKPRYGNEEKEKLL